MGRGGQPGAQLWPPAASGRFEDADEDPLAPAMGSRTRVCTRASSQHMASSVGPLHSIGRCVCGM